MSGSVHVSSCWYDVSDVARGHCWNQHAISAGRSYSSPAASKMAWDSEIVQSAGISAPRADRIPPAGSCQFGIQAEGIALWLWIRPGYPSIVLCWWTALTSLWLCMLIPISCLSSKFSKPSAWLQRRHRGIDPRTKFQKSSHCFVSVLDLCKGERGSQLWRIQQQHCWPGFSSRRFWDCKGMLCRGRNISWARTVRSVTALARLAGGQLFFFRIPQRGLHKKLINTFAFCYTQGQIMTHSIESPFPFSCKLQQSNWDVLPR